MEVTIRRTAGAVSADGREVAAVVIMRSLSEAGARQWR